MHDIDRTELELLRRFKKETEDHIEEVDKLMKYTTEMQTLTQYKSGDKPNIQKLRIWTTNIMRMTK